MHPAIVMFRERHQLDTFFDAFFNTFFFDAFSELPFPRCLFGHHYDDFAITFRMSN